MLQFFVRELKGLPIIVVATYRDHEMRESAELSKFIGQLGTDNKQF
jgi:hypothetical protein